MNRQPDTPTLDVRDLRHHFFLDRGRLEAVNGVSFTIAPGEILGIIGESGCGKSITARSILKLESPPGRIVSGEVRFQTAEREMVDICTLQEGSNELLAIRGRDIGFIFQEPSAAFSPVQTIGRHMVELLQAHLRLDAEVAGRRAIDALGRAGLRDAERVFTSYSFELSGGMCQRAAIALALCTEPALLIADEPTTALDVTVQAELLRLILTLRDESRMSVLYISHDLGVMANIADTVAVMYLGQIVEMAPVRELLENPMHPYTQKLLQSVPSIDQSHGRLATIPGSVPVPIDLPSGCSFGPRCEQFIPGTCDVRSPGLSEARSDHCVRCFLHSEATEPINE